MLDGTTTHVTAFLPSAKSSQTHIVPSAFSAEKTKYMMNKKTSYHRVVCVFVSL